MNQIIIFAKAPVPGRVKTRLCPPLNPEEAAAVHAAMTRDVWAAARQVPGIKTKIALDPAGSQPDTAWIDPDAPPSFFLQEGADLGERLQRAARRAFARGAERALIIGSDSPEIRPGRLTVALKALDRSDIVLGAAADGGYYLIGLRQERPEIFKGISWSTPKVLSETRAIARGLGLSISWLPQVADMDTFGDLQALYKRAGESSRQELPHTLRALGRIFTTKFGTMDRTSPGSFVCRHTGESRCPIHREQERTGFRLQPAPYSDTGPE